MELGGTTTPVYLIDLQNKRKQRRWTRTEAAEVLGIHEQHLYRIEKGRSGASFDLALRCAREFGPLKVSSPWGHFLIVPESFMPPSDNNDGDSVSLAGSHRRVRRPQNVGIPVNCMVAMREVSQLASTLREIHDSILDVEMGRPGAELRLEALVKEAQEAFFWIATLLMHIGERYPSVLDSGTAMAVGELHHQIGYEEVNAA